ncbi:hypothetical protein TIFTF001_003405 [Ficus carica]|uniref:Uncharacterized protein n=1 Tax=Ficus carica TaxID=3494 RepID=A0AA88CU49_FICCA|nr:hypothetical protein TIFTF001_003405 [Ficus carica]
MSQGSKAGSGTKSSCSWSMRRHLTVGALLSSSSSSTASEDPGNRLIGASRILLGSFGNCGRCYYEGTTGTFRVFYVRDRNGESRGILNLGVTILDGLLPYQVINDQFIGVGSTIDYQKLFGDGARACEKEKKGVSVSCLAA